MEKTRLGQNLYTLRKGRGLSQEELADQLGVSRQAISKWERDEAYPDTENLIAISKLYGVSLDDLVYAKSLSPSEMGAEATDGACEAVDPEGVDPTAEAPKEDAQKQGLHFQMQLPHNEEDEDDEEDETAPEVIESKKKFRLWYSLPYPIVITAIYLLWGFLWDGWAVGWTLYVTVPVYYSVIDCIRRKRITPFCYPVFVAFLYLLVGMAWGIWHPTWIAFVTIPVFYPIASAIDKRK